MKVEQTSELFKASKSTIQRIVNAIVGTMKINSQEIDRPSVVMFDEITLPDKYQK
jgi:hypothetical protein